MTSVPRPYRPDDGWRHLRPLALALLVLGCVPGEQEVEAPGDTASRFPNLVVILSDTHRFDHVSPDDRGRRLTPNLALLARDGMRFDGATTPIPISAPAYASLLTGLPPTPREIGGHGLLNNHQHLGEALPRLPVLLRERGYRSAGIVANPFCSAAHGFAEGFDFFWDDVEGTGKEGEHITHQAITWLDRILATAERPETSGQAATPAPFFLFVAYMDAHTPYVGPTSQPSLLARIDGEPCCLLWAENSHLEQRIPLVAAPGTTWVELDFVDDARDPGSGLSLGIGSDELPGTDHQGLPPSPLYLAEPRLGDSRLRFGRVEGLEPPAEGSSFRRLARRARFEIVNPTREPLATELRFHGYRRYGPEDTPRRYRAGIRAADRHIGTLLGALEARGLYHDTVIVFLSDHGEMLGEHGDWGHVDHLWRETLRIPLVVKAPGYEPNSIRRGDFGITELHRLLLALAMPADATDHDTAVEMPTLEPTRFASTYPPEAETLRVAVRRDSLELHLDQEGHIALYDLASDPGQSENLFDRRRDQGSVRELLREARARLDAVGAASLPGGLGELDAEQRRKLEALGYLDP